MADFDYRQSVEKDTLEQFRGQPNIQVLHDVLAKQLQDVYDFFMQLKLHRWIHDAVGKQLDGVGDIVVLSRAEASEYAKAAGLGDASDDEVYRKYLYYKVLKNTNNCTYPELIKAFRMFWEKPLYYHEDPEYPATMFLDTGILTPDDHAEDLLSSPIIKAAGVGIHITATTESPVNETTLHITPVAGRGMTITELPEVEPEMPAAGIFVAPAAGRGMSITVLPHVDPDLGTARVRHHVTAAMVGSIMETRLPPMPEFDTEVPSVVDARISVAPHGSFMETRLPELKEEIV